MSLYETAPELIATSAQEAIIEVGHFDYRLPSGHEVAIVADAEVATAETQGFRYVRKDGTVEHAATPEEVFKRCSVLGELAMKDPDIANLLLDIASIGQTKIAREERSKPEATKPAREPATKSSKTTSITQPETATTKNNEMPSKSRELRLEQIETARREILELSAQAVELEPLITGETPGKLKVKEAPKKNVVTTARTKAQESAIHKKPRENQTVTRRRNMKTDTRLALISTEQADRTHESKSHEAADRPAPQARPKRQAQSEKQYQIKVVNKKAKPAITVKKVIREKFISREDQTAAQSEPAATHCEEIAVEPIVSPTEVPFFEMTELPHETLEQVIETATTERDPLKFYDDFTEELQSLIATMEILSADDTEEVSEFSAAARTAGESKETELQVENTPAVILAVAERLNELDTDQKVAVALTLQDIVEAARSAELLQETESQPREQLEVTEAAAERLKEQVAVLFEQLGVDYEPEDIEQFIKILPALNKQVTAPELQEKAAEADLEHDGTREAKWRLSRLTGNLSDARSAAGQLLGQLALLRVSNRRQTELA
jgi:hypothetical protein